MIAQAKAQAAQLRRAWIAAGRATTSLNPPAITAGKLVSANLNTAKPPTAPIVSVTFTTDTPGLCYLYVELRSATTLQSLNLNYSQDSHVPPLTGGTVKFENANFSYGYGSFNAYSAPGEWDVTQAIITDCAGTNTYYNASQTFTMFSPHALTLTNNRNPDTAAPLFHAGTVVTRTVSLGAALPDFIASLQVSDDVSGLYSIQVNVCPPTPSGGYCVSGIHYAPLPVLNATSKVYTWLGAQHITGQWTIAAMQACDIAANCVYDSSASDIQALFGTTTFRVTN